MANLEGKTYHPAKNVPGRKGYIFIPTPAMRRQGMYYRQYPNGKGGIICYSHIRAKAASKFNPRLLPVVLKGGNEA